MPKERREKFVSLANKRVNRALKDMQLIGNLSNKSAYEYTDVDVRKILRALQNELDVVKARFVGPKTNQGSEFSLDSV